MFWKYTKIAMRHILRHKGHSFINIAGLSIGITICILIAIYIHFELSFDRYHADALQIYRIALEFENMDHQIEVTPVVQASIGSTMKAEFPEIEICARVFTYTWRETALITNGEKHFYEDRFFLGEVR